jgi:hypothetical protein
VGDVAGDDRAAGPVRLITGPGGVGKTRLSIQLCHEAEKHGWHTDYVRAGAEASVIANVRALVPGRLLLVVDYAETRLELRQFLRTVLDDVLEDNVGALKVLLLARSVGRWWEELRDMESAVRELISGACHSELPTIISDGVHDADLVQAAIPPLATRLGITEPTDVAFLESPSRARILDLHMAALTAILSGSGRSDDQVPASSEDALVQLLKHEERFWLATARRAGLMSGLTGLSPATLRRIVAAACLLGARTKDEAIDFLERVPETQPTEAVATWLRDLYPPGVSSDAPSGESGWLGVLQPDRLAEFLTVNELCDSPEFADSCLSSISPRQGFRATALLGRARIDDTRAEPFFEKVLQAILYYISHHPDWVDATTIMMVADLIPYSSLRLLYTSNALRRLYDQAPLSDQAEKWKLFLVKLSDYLARTMMRLENFPPADLDEGAYQGSLASAFPPIETEKTKALRKDLEETYPPLAETLTRFGMTGSLEEAAAIYRGLVAVYPDRYTLKLVRTLTNLRQRLSQEGRDAEAQEVRIEAARLRERWKDMVYERRNTPHSRMRRLP